MKLRSLVYMNNKTNKVIDPDNSMVASRGEGGERRWKRVKGVKYTVIGVQILGVDHTMEYIDGGS